MDRKRADHLHGAALRAYIYTQGVAFHRCQTAAITLLHLRSLTRAQPICKFPSVSTFHIIILLLSSISVPYYTYSEDILAKPR